MDEKQITEQLQNAVNWLRKNLDWEFTLSEILELRRDVARTLELNSRTEDFTNMAPPSLDAIVALLRNHFGIDYYDLMPKREDGRHVLGLEDVWGWSKLVSDEKDKTKISAGFKEYLHIVQERSYQPFIYQTF